MKRILIPTRVPEDWKWLLAKPDLHWRHGRSAMACALAWEKAVNGLPDQIGKVLDASGEAALSDLKLLAAVPEWQVPLPGSTTTSNTDVMAFCSNPVGLCVLAIEAKVDESFGPLLGEKRVGHDQGALTRIDFLQEVLQVPTLGDDIRYQLLHRTVSAILTARDFHAATAVMIVQAFDTPEYCRKDFERFVDATHAVRLSASVWRLVGHESPVLYLAWVDDTLINDI